MEAPKIDELLKTTYEKAFNAGVEAGQKQAPKPPPPSWDQYVKKARAWASKGFTHVAAFAAGWLLASPDRDKFIDGIQGFAGLGLVVVLGVLGYEYFKGKK